MVNTTVHRESSAPRRPSITQMWEWLTEIADPEIPVVSIVDLGIVRNVVWEDKRDACVVTITPTYSGCPATSVIQALIREELTKHGIPKVQLKVQLSPAWTTDWLTRRGREHLRAFGIAPPEPRAPETSASVLPVIDCTDTRSHPPCPRCGSTHTSAVSQFGSTLCKALYRCEDCMEPFDYFKCH
jgi:ring-1,2-phenylacetyl-CoA epoxidase subunit PaaD